MKNSLITFCERSVSILSFIFAFTEISSCFAVKVFLNSDSPSLKYIYVNYISKLINIYIGNAYLIFALMIGIFIVCSRGNIPLTKYVRFNIIQAILLDIVCLCISSVFPVIPLTIRESSLGLLFANFVYLGVIFVIVYSAILISYGKHAKIPIISEAARLQLQRGYVD